MNSSKCKTPSTPFLVPDWAWVALIVVVATIVNWPGVKSPPFLDDLDGLTYTSAFTHWSQIWGPDSFGLFRPVKNLIFYLYGRTGVDSIAVWHGMVMAAFLLTIPTVFVLCRYLFKSAGWPLLATAAWALAPTQTSTVVWMSCINISVSVIFLNLFLVFHIRTVGTDKIWTRNFVVALVLLFLAQISYETAVAAAALAMIHDLFLFPTSKNGWLRRGFRYAGYGLVTLGFLTIRHFNGAVSSSQKSNFGFSPDIEKWQLSVSGPWFMFKHLMMWLLPVGRIEFISTYVWGKSATTMDLVVAWVVVILLLGIAWQMRKKSPLFAFGIFWFFLTLFPSSNLIPIYAGPIEDYYLVIPSIGLVIALVAIVKALVDYRTRAEEFGHRGRVLAAVLMLAWIAIFRLAFVPLCWFQADLWNKPLELNFRIANSRPYQFQAQGLAARILFIDGDFSGALILAEEAYATAPWYGIGPMVGGSTLVKMNRPLEAVQRFDAALDVFPKHSKLSDYCNLKLAEIYGDPGSMNDFSKSRGKLILILENRDSIYFREAIHLLSTNYQKQGKLDEALATLAKGLRVYPKDQMLISHELDVRNLLETSH